MRVVLVRSILLGMLCFLGTVQAEVAVVLNSGDGTISLVDKNTYKETKKFFVGSISLTVFTILL